MRSTRLPRIATDYIPDHAPAYAEMDRQFSMCRITSGVSLTDFSDIAFREPRTRMVLAGSLTNWRDEIVRPGMFHIGAMRYVFQVVQSIIDFRAILMIYLHALWTWAKKSCGYKTMYPAFSAHAMNPKIDAQISSGVKAWRQQTSFGLTFYATLIRHAIVSFVANDRFPIFRYDRFKHSGLLSSSLCPGPHAATTARRPELYPSSNTRQGGQPRLKKA